MDILRGVRQRVVYIMALSLALLIGLGMAPAQAGGDLEPAKKEGKVVWYSRSPCRWRRSCATLPDTFSADPGTWPEYAGAWLCCNSAGV
jgi:hypothetical protein